MPLEITYFTANLTEVSHGGGLPLLIAVTVFTIMMTWQRGREIVTVRRTDMQGAARLHRPPARADGATGTRHRRLPAPG